MTFYIDYENGKNENTFDFDIRKLYETVALAVLDARGCPFEAEVSLIITDNEGIREINQSQRNIDSPTDVLSFPMHQFEVPSAFEELDDCDDCFNPETGELMLGDIVVSADRVKSQAKEYGHGEIREFAFLIAHSMLHLIGYDHMNEDEAKVMFGYQEDILTELSITR